MAAQSRDELVKAFVDYINTHHLLDTSGGQIVPAWMIGTLPPTDSAADVQLNEATNFPIEFLDALDNFLASYRKRDETAIKDTGKILETKLYVDATVKFMSIESANKLAGMLEAIINYKS